MMRFILCVVAISLVASEADAGRVFKRRARASIRVRQTPTTTSVKLRSVGGTDQQRAEAEAAAMAAAGIKGHVGGCIGLFEGVGWSSSTPNCATCTPSRSMRLTADAVVRGRDGWYRVRAWR